MLERPPESAKERPKRSPIGEFLTKEMQIIKDGIEKGGETMPRDQRDKLRANENGIRFFLALLESEGLLQRTISELVAITLGDAIAELCSKPMAPGLNIFPSQAEVLGLLASMKTLSSDPE